MLLCEFCDRYGANGECGLGLAIPKRMSCRDFDPTVERFCADAADFVGAAQLVQMATYFGLGGPELKKVRHVAAREEACGADAAGGSRAALRSGRP